MSHLLRSDSITDPAHAREFLDLSQFLSSVRREVSVPPSVKGIGSRIKKITTKGNYEREHCRVARPEQMQGSRVRETPLGGDNHIHQDIETLRFHQFGWATQCKNRKRPLPHLTGGPCDLLDVDSALDGTHPENVLSLDSLEGLVCSANCLVNSPSSSLRIAVEARWKIKNYSDVSFNLFLVSDNLRWLHPYMPILKNLVCPRVCRNRLVEPKRSMYILWRLTWSPSLQEV